MAKKSHKNKSHSGDYDSSESPLPDGRVGTHKPRRNYWGNLYDEDTFDENRKNPQNYDYSDFDREDDHDSFYDSESYD